MKISLLQLIRTFLGDIRTLLLQEMLLAKTEISEKWSHVRRDITALVIGGSAAYAGAVVLILAFGLLLAWAISIAGIPALLAGFIGLTLAGGLVTAGGVFLLFKAVETLKREPIALEKSMETLRHLQRNQGTSEPIHQPAIATKPESKLSSEELQRLAFVTEENLDKTLEELNRRLNPKEIKGRMTRQVREHPYKASLIAVTAGLVGAVLMRRRHA